MDIEIVYITSILKGKMTADGFPLFSDVTRKWSIKTKEYSSIKSTKEALNAFYKWAVKNEHGAIVTKIIFKDFL